MGRYFGRVGFGRTEEVRPGVREDVITERKLYGDVLSPSRSFQEGEKVNRDASVGNRISVLADNYTNENIDSIRFVEWKGVLWYVTKIVDERPRLIFSLGEVYNGPVAPTDPGDN